MDDVVAKYAAAESRFVDVDGVRVHYRDEGTGPAVLLLHGTLGDLSDWDEWALELKKQYRVIRLDLPGFGLSGDIANGNYSVGRMHALIDGLMDHLEQEQFAIVSISYGGIVAFRYAATRTDRITAMVLMNSAGIESGRSIPEAEPKRDLQPRTTIFNNPIVTRADVVEFYNAYINDPNKRTPELIQRKLDMLNIVGRDEVSKLALGLYERGNPQRVLAHVRAPSLVMWGEGNYALSTKTASAFVDALKNACLVELVTFVEGGHYINVERPQETVLAANAFLTKVLNDPPVDCKPRNTDLSSG